MKAWELMAEIAKWPCNMEVAVDVPYANAYVNITGVEETPEGLALVTDPVEIGDDDTEGGD